MNLYAIFHCQRIVFAILFILTGIYLVLFLIKEIYYLFVPPKQVPEISRSVLEIKSDKENEIFKKIIPKERKSRKRRKNKS